MKKITLLSFMLLFAVTSITSTVFAKDPSGSKDVVQVANLAELVQQEADNTTIYEITGEIFLTHQHDLRGQKYFQDGTAAIMIDDNGGIITTTYELYDGITGLKGRLDSYNQLLQLIPEEDPGPATSEENLVEPTLLTLADLDPSHQSMLVRINAVDFVGDYTNFTGSTNYNIEDPSGTGLLRTPNANANLDYFGTPVPDETTDMIVIISQFNATMQVFPRSLSDFYPDGLPAYTVTFSIIDEDNDPINDAVITFAGETFTAGEYVFEEVDAGNYPFSVEKSGYYTRTGTVAVTGNDIERTVVLVAIDPNAVSTFPWEENFEGEEFPPLTWSHYAYGAGGWASTSTAHTGAKAAWHTFTTTEANSWLVSPQIQIPEDISLLLKFFQRNNFMSDYEYSAVKISTGSGNPMQDEFVEVYEASAEIGTYTERIVNLADYAGKVVYIAFVYEGNDAHQWYIDDITIEEAPAAVEVDNIAALYDAEVGDLIYQVTGEVFITHQQQAYRGQMYIQDESAAIMIDDPAGIITTEYNNYDGLTNIKGTLSVFQDMLQFVPTEDFGAPNSTGNTVEPMVVTLAELTEDIQGMLVLVRNVSFDFDNPDFPDSPDFTHNQSYYILDDTGTGEIRTPNSPDLLDYFGTAIPTTPKDIVGVLHQRYEVTRLQPRSLADFLEPTSIQEIEAAGFNVFPNPAVTHFNISGEQTIDFVRVYNMSGQLVIQEQVNNSSADIDVSVLKTGIYIVQIIYGTNKLNYKLQIQK